MSPSIPDPGFTDASDSDAPDANIQALDSAPSSQKAAETAANTETDLPESAPMMDLNLDGPPEPEIQLETISFGNDPLFDSATQGDPTVLRNFFNRELQAHQAEIAEIELRDSTLQISVAADAVPVQEQMLPLFKAWLLQLALVKVSRVELYGQKTTSELPFWRSEFELADLELTSTAETTEPDPAADLPAGSPQTGAEVVPAPPQDAVQQILSRAESARSQAVEDLLGRYEAGLRDFRQVNLEESNLANATLSLADLTGAQLVWANLSGASLYYVNLTGAKLRHADLRGAKLRNANLKGADFLNANLTGADLSWCNLSGANLTGANLTDANLQNAILDHVTMPDGTLLN